LPTFFQKKPLTAAEQAVYFRLVEALPDHVVLAQVQVSQVVGIKKEKGFQTWFNKISRKSYDYLVCAKDFTVVAAIELDDATHQRSDRQVADADKNTATAAAGYKLIRWQATNPPAVDAIREALGLIAVHA
jgi:hypothetical protein